jgi:hypothetical protein
MRTSAKLGLTTLIAALLLASAVSAASASNLSIEPQNIRTTWSSLEFVSPIVTVRCPVTLEGSFHSRTMPKVMRLLIGAVTRVTIKRDSCREGEASITGLPWHITYEGFAGTLPRITAIRLLLSRFLFNINRPLGLARTCKYGTATDNVSGDASINPELLVRNLIPVNTRNEAHILEGILSGLTPCPTEGRLVGSTADGVTRILNTEGFIKVALI